MGDEDTATQGIEMGPASHLKEEQKSMEAEAEKIPGCGRLMEGQRGLRRGVLVKCFFIYYIYIVTDAVTAAVEDHTYIYIIWKPHHALRRVKEHATRNK